MRVDRFGISEREGSVGGVQLIGLTACACNGGCPLRLHFGTAAR